ncbi:MAG: hypothetical protein MUE57_01725 [Syntrophales bacterium]|nr:hypothetical protein [Syntrophales bacterium]
MSEPVESRRCPYCLREASPGLAAGGWRFFQCSNCRLVFRDGLDVPETVVEERRYYEDDYFRELAWDQLEGYRDGIYREALDRIEGQVGRGRLLDVGCGCGFFLREALAGVDRLSPKCDRRRGDPGNPGELRPGRALRRRYDDQRARSPR